MTYEEIISKVAERNGYDCSFVDKVYKLFWFCIKEKIKELPLKDALSEEEFKGLVTNFNIPSLGKLTCTYERWKGIKRRFKYINDIRKRNEGT